MDALLTRPACQALAAAALSGRRAASGLLLGHKRGGRFIVERAVLSGSGVFPGREAYLRLASLLGDEVIGFFSFSAASPLRKKAPPFGMGKIFLAIRTLRSGGFSPRAFLLDYADRFSWKPVKLVIPKKDGRHA